MSTSTDFIRKYETLEAITKSPQEVSAVVRGVISHSLCGGCLYLLLFVLCIVHYIYCIIVLHIIFVYVLFMVCGALALCRFGKQLALFQGPTGGSRWE